MAQKLSMAAQLLSNTVRFGYYSGVNWLASKEARRFAQSPAYKPTRPVPSPSDLFSDIGQLFMRDAQAVRDGIYPFMLEPAEGLSENVSRVRAMLGDLPDSVRRRQEKETDGAKARPGADDLPDYFKQDFHFQRDGYLSDDSAKLYDVQVETLFYGAAGAMRRASIPALAAFMRGKDQRKTNLLDVGCGTGRLLREIRTAYPAMRASGLDLSKPYLEEARRHTRDLRRIEFFLGNAEAIPLPDASQDIVTCSYLFHELPGDVRRQVAREIARVLVPGGLFLFVDSLQYGDRPGWDGLVEAFPHRFHEPFYAHYASDDLIGLFAEAGLNVEDTSVAFLSKVMAMRRSAPRTAGSNV